MIKKSRNKILSLIIFIGLISILYATQAEGGSDQINPTTPGGIQAAIDDASVTDGDIIELADGTYTGTGNYNVTVNKSVTIKTASNSNPIINAEGNDTIFNITANGVILNGLTITGVKEDSTTRRIGAIGNNGTSVSVINTTLINNTIEGYNTAVIFNSGINFSVINSTLNNNTGLPILNYGYYNNDAYLSVIGCDIISDGGYTVENFAGLGDYCVVNFNRLNCIVDMIDNADYNWWGDNNRVGGYGTVVNHYFVIQLSAKGNYTRNDTTMRGLLAPIPLTYNMVLNDTNNSGDISNLPDFNTTIKLTGSVDESINAKGLWSTTLTNSGKYDFTAICDNEDLTIKLDKKNTILTLNTILDTVIGQATNITGNLKSSSVGLGDKNVTVNITNTLGHNNISINCTTNSAGGFNYSFIPEYAGEYNVTVNFDGDEECNPSNIVNQTVKVIAGKEDTTLTLNTILDTVVGQATNIAGNLKSSSVGLGDKNVTVNITNTLGHNNISINCTTNSAGGFNYSFIPKYAGEYNVTVNFDGDEDYNPSNIINQTVIVDHPRYDLSLRSEPSGHVYVGTWINSIAIVIGDTPLNDDYCIFKVTYPSGEVKSSDHKSFNGKDSEPYQWQLTEKGRYLVEVWAFDKDGNHVKVHSTPPSSTSQLFKPNVMKSFMEYSTSGTFYGDSISKVQSNALEVINVE